MLDQEFKYYLAHQSELVKLYDGLYLVIVGDKVVATYKTFADAVNEGRKMYKPGTFLVQRCSEGNKDYTFKTHSRVKLPFHESPQIIHA